MPRAIRVQTGKAFSPAHCGSLRLTDLSAGDKLSDCMNDIEYNIDATYFSIFPRSWKGKLSLLLALIALLGTGCGRLYRVAPLVTTNGGSLVSGSLGSVAIGVRALDGDEALEQFEANLPMAGVLAVEVRMINRGPSPLPLEKVEFSLLDDRGAGCPSLAPEEALKRVMRFYGNRIYQVEAHRETTESYQQIALRRIGELTLEGEVHGILFFAIPRQAPLGDNLSLRVKLSGETITLMFGVVSVR